MKNKIFWKIIYKLHPPALKILEIFKVHSYRQNFLIGHLSVNFLMEDLKDHLLKNDFERAILAWREPDEILNMRKIIDKIFQYHIRLFADGEIRAHYEYTSEGRPWKHIKARVFEPKHDYFNGLLADFLK